MTQMNDNCAAPGVKSPSRLAALLAHAGVPTLAAPAPVAALGFAPPPAVAVAPAKPKAQFEQWITAGAQAVTDVGVARAPEQALRPALSAPRDPSEITFTIGTAPDVRSPVENESTSLAELAALMTERGAKIGPKADQGLITAATFRDGARKDESTTAVSLFLIDADGAGDLAGLRRVLADEGIAHVWAWSTRCDPGAGKHKYHIVIPLAAPIEIADGETDHETVRDRYKHPYAFALGAIAKIAGLPGALDGAMASPCQPFYLAERETEDAPPREVSCVGGRCLDLLAFVRALGFDEFLVKQEQVQAQQRAETRAAFEGLTVDGDEGLRVAAARCDIASDSAFWGVGQSEGGRHDATFKAATRLGVGFDLSETVVESLLRGLAATMDPPPDESEITNGIFESRRHATPAHPYGWKYARHLAHCARCRAKVAAPASASAQVQAPLSAPAPAQAMPKTVPPGTWLTCPSCSGKTVANDLGQCMLCTRPVGVREQTADEVAGVVAETVVPVAVVGHRIEINEPTAPYGERPRSETTTKAINALVEHGDVYVRDGRLCEVVCLGEGAQIVEMDVPRAQDLLSAPVATWIEWRRATKAQQAGGVYVIEYPHATASKDVCASVLRRKIYPGARPIRLVTSAPQFRADGTVQTTVGYDAASRTYLSEGVDLPALGETEDEAVTAAQTLLELVEDFPLAAPARGRGIWLATILTRLCRATIAGPIPMVVARATAPGSGKGKLLNLVPLICDGRPLSVSPNRATDEELSKRIVSVLRAGRAMASIDNIADGSKLDSPALAALLTATEYSDRLLSKNEDPTYPALTQWVASGNAIGLSSEIERRSLVIDLRVDGADPEGRTGFRFADLEGQALAERARYLHAALTLLRAWHCAGRPVLPGPAKGSYEAWGRGPRAVVQWLATLPGLAGQIADPVHAQEAGENADRLAHGLLAQRLAEYLTAVQGEAAGLSAAEIADGAGDKLKPLSALREVLSEQVETLSAWAIGRFVGRYLDRWVLCPDGVERKITRTRGGRGGGKFTVAVKILN